MISEISQLLRLDLLSSRGWFKKETVWKSLIALAFTLLLVGISILVYSFSRFYFKYLTDFAIFGTFTVEYVLNASVLFVVWVGVLSAFVATLVFLLSPNKLVDYLVQLPINPLSIVFWQAIKTLFLNLVLFAIVIFPLFLAYNNVFSLGLTIGFSRAAFVLLVMSLLGESIGSIFAYLLADRLKSRQGVFYLLVTSIFFLTITVLVFNKIFPPQLRELENVSSQNFVSAFNELPLIHSCFIAGSLTDTLMLGFSGSSALILFIAAVLMSLSLVIQKKLFISNWQKVRLSLYLPGPLIFRYFHPKSLSGKDVLSVIRSPKELGYGIFLFLMLVAFLSLFARGIEVRRIPTTFANSAYIFSWFWLVFYSGTYLIRLVFPLMAKEGNTRWWLFTLPQKTEHLIISKVSSSIFLTIPLFLVCLLQWYLTPYGMPSVYVLFMALLVIFWLSVLLVMIGMFKPDYSNASNPEKVSTGLTGIAALVLVVFVGLIYCGILAITGRSGVTPADSLSLLFAISLTTTAMFYYFTFSAISKYSLEA